MTEEMRLLIDKIDYLTEQAEAQRRRQEAVEELLRDLAPVARHAMQIATTELDEISGDVSLEETLLLVKRLLRSVKLLSGMLESVESGVELAGEVQRLAQPAFIELIQRLDALERRGYFAFATEAARIIDRIVSEFSREDVQALGDNIVTILSTVRQMTQPEIMAMANNAFARLEEPVSGEVSTWALLRELRDPEVRRGTARLLHMVRGFAQPISES
ncbi:DUF1641 domain-containing protein [Anaerolineae bacterium CFX9]|nr:DUF1641 domain-containing protein [Anaerolineae bacterium CFX9]